MERNSPFSRQADINVDRLEPADTYKYSQS